MKKYLSITKMSLKRQLKYKGSMISMLLARLMYIYGSFCIWNYCFSNSPSEMNYMFKYILVTTLLNIVLDNDIALDVSDLIKKGEFVSLLTKPMNSLLAMWAKDLGEIISRLIGEGAIILILILLNNEHSISILQLVCFGMIIVLSYCFSSLLYVNLGCLAFVFDSVRPFNACMGCIISILGGAFFPIEFYPSSILKIVEFLPFKYMYYYPSNLLMEKGFTVDYIYLRAVFALAMGILFLVILFRIIFYKISRNISIYGG